MQGGVPCVLGCLTVLGQIDHGCRKLGTDMSFRRRLPEIRCLSHYCPGNRAQFGAIQLNEGSLSDFEAGHDLNQNGS
jgi:hypothetical protein